MRDLWHKRWDLRDIIITITCIHPLYFRVDGF